MTDERKFTSGERVWVRGIGLATYEYDVGGDCSLVIVDPTAKHSTGYACRQTVEDVMLIKLADIERAVDQTILSGVYLTREDDRTIHRARVLVPVECPSASSAVSIDGMTLNSAQLDRLWRYFLHKADVL